MIVGELRIPLYTDDTYSEIKKYWRVPIVDRQKALAYGRSKYLVEYSGGSTLEIYNSGLNYGSDGETSKRLRFTTQSGSWGSANDQRQVTATQCGIMGDLATSAVLFNPTRNTFSNYTILGVFGESGEYFIKNGSKVTSEYAEELNSTLGHNVGVRKIKFFTGATQIFSRNFIVDLKEVSQSEATKISSSIQYAEAVVKARQISAGLKVRFGSNVVCYLFDNIEDQTSSSNAISDVLETTWEIGTGNVSSTNNNTGVVNIYGNTSIPSNVLVPRLLGYNIQQSIDDSIVDYVDNPTDPDGSDADNTYPGGGDDKNTYPPDGESGKGTFDNTNDPVDFPSMPLWDATSTGFISMWNPTITEITQLYSFLWDSDISTTLKKLFLEPMDAIISLAFFPVDPVNFPEKRNVTIGHVDTKITMYAVQKQFVDFDFGTIKLDEYYGAAWDYSPYTKVSIYLPYIGSQELDVDDVMNADLHLQYRIDLLSGMCAAMLKCTRDRDDLDAVVYTWQGNCAMQVPITAGSAREFINSIIQLGAMTGLALVQPAAGALAMGTGDFSMSADIMAMKNNFVNPTMATYAALNVLGQKVHVQRGGRVDANAGVMSPQSAYLIIDRPISAIPKGWNEYAGYPSLKIKALSTQKGMTQVAYIKLNGLEATAEEISELDSILKAGVIL